MKEPKRNAATHLCCLKTGDRFYLKDDPKKEIWELRYQTTIKIRGQPKKLSVCKNGEREQRRFDANRVVFFLRRTIPDRPRVREFSIDRYFA
jgi:hypothetical protein